ncbi:hypothetical protein BGX30_005028 [Mortierella sp. GBA39]|nr:hypothetical protein BGX30_005028 [Mortierella sp. GBA39]
MRAAVDSMQAGYQQSKFEYRRHFASEQSSNVDGVEEASSVANFEVYSSVGTIATTTATTPPGSPLLDLDAEAGRGLTVLDNSSQKLGDADRSQENRE